MKADWLTSDWWQRLSAYPHVILFGLVIVVWIVSHRLRKRRPTREELWACGKAFFSTITAIFILVWLLRHTNQELGGFSVVMTGAVILYGIDAFYALADNLAPLFKKEDQAEVTPIQTTPTPELEPKRSIEAVADNPGTEAQKARVRIVLKEGEKD